MEVIEQQPSERVTWKVVDGPEDWVGTTIDWQLRQDGEHTIVMFRHQDWKEPVEFMHHCSTKWATFLMSLKSLIEDGQGAPAPQDVHIAFPDRLTGSRPWRSGRRPELLVVRVVGNLRLRPPTTSPVPRRSLDLLTELQYRSPSYRALTVVDGQLEAEVARIGPARDALVASLAAAATDPRPLRPLMPTTVRCVGRRSGKRWAAGTSVDVHRGQM